MFGKLLVDRVQLFLHLVYFVALFDCAVLFDLVDFFPDWIHIFNK